MKHAIQPGDYVRITAEPEELFTHTASGTVAFLKDIWPDSPSKMFIKGDVCEVLEPADPDNDVRLANPIIKRGFCLNLACVTLILMPDGSHFRGLSTE